ncbi:uncharacterized protein V1510DRAFT_422467 [Dipodascopsis tothii]|uniref:uncharacterized protein n=1 Tax=Dipodascopsis tothii TaxID=44089 RepID=UPI0034D01423
MKQATDMDIPDRRIGTFVAYLTSPFALLCMLMAVILNRTVVFASVRRPQPLPPSARLLIRSVAILQLARAMGPILTALKCYSPGLAPYIPGVFAVADGEACPTPDVLWYLYKAFCTGHFVETFSNALQGRVPSPDTGMTLFEYSLAFQEAQSAQRPSVEVLVISLIWASNYLVFLVISVFNLQNYRLVSSSLFGMISLSYFAYSTYCGRAQFFPTVWVIGFAPHLAVLYVIVICGSIYLLAALFAGGTANLQNTLTTINISAGEDFYSCLLKLGITVLTSASDALYTSEGPRLALPEATWLDTLENPDLAGFVDAAPPDDEYLQISYTASATGARDVRYLGSYTPPRRRLVFSATDGAVDAVLDADGAAAVPAPATVDGVTHAVIRRRKTSGYATMNRASKVGGPLAASARHTARGRVRDVMLLYRLSMAYTLVRSTLVLFARLLVDVVRRRLRPKTATPAPTPVFVSPIEEVVPERVLSDDELYARFLQDRPMPEYDASADFAPDDDDDDDDYADDSSDSDDDRLVLRARDPALDQELFPEARNLPADITLSSLLLPQSYEELEYARVLTAHLSASHILTRSRHRELFADEADSLAAVITDRRPARTRVFGEDDDDDITTSHSLCVVCHSSQRNVVLWPCRCLAICEDCRVSLALRNFKGCVCCRREVTSFSRLYVP